MKSFFRHRQGTLEWWLARKGKFTATDIRKVVIDKTPIEEIALEKALQRLGMDIKEKEDEKAKFGFAWGRKFEPIARKAFEQFSGFGILEVGFIEAPEFPGWFGASPDGIEETFLFGLEVKALNRRDHEIIRAERKIPERYKYQVASGMIATEIPSWYFVAYHPQADMVVVEVSADELQKEIEKTKEVVTLAVEQAKKYIRQFGGTV